MRIGIDARTILNPEKGDAIGVGHYTYQLIRHLLDIDKENKYVLFFDFRVREKDVKKFARPNVKIKFYPFSDYSKYLPGVYDEILGSATLSKEKLDLVHSTSPLSRIPMSYGGKTVVTIYDLGVYKVPDAFPQLYRAKMKTMTSMMANKAEKIIAVSGAIKNDLVKLLECPEDKIKVIYSGLDKRFFAPAVISSEKVLGKFSIKDKYILFLGTLEPVKNLSRLFEAFKLFKEKLKKEKSGENYKLVVAGKRGWLSEEYKQIAKDLGLGKDVIFTGYIIGDELVPLFSGATFFAMPSLYEGFGATVLEAMACGTPVIVSRVSSIPEIAGDAVKFINPLDTNELAETMLEFSQNEELRQQYKEKGQLQAKNFDWEKCARETLEVYKSLK